MTEKEQLLHLLAGFNFTFEFILLRIFWTILILFSQVHFVSFFLLTFQAVILIYMQGNVKIKNSS